MNTVLRQPTLTQEQAQEVLRQAWRWADKLYERQESNGPWCFEESDPPSFDCSTLVCRVAKDALGMELPDNAETLAKVLSEVSVPVPGDLVFYPRPATPSDFENNELVLDETVRACELAADRTLYHVMFFVDHARVFGACDIGERVMERPTHYENGWRLIDSPYRRLVLRNA